MIFIYTKLIASVYNDTKPSQLVLWSGLWESGVLFVNNTDEWEHWHAATVHSAAHGSLKSYKNLGDTNKFPLDTCIMWNWHLKFTEMGGSFAKIVNVSLKEAWVTISALIIEKWTILLSHIY